jgi:PIN domain nuclease of toxin-antitoxin system
MLLLDTHTAIWLMEGRVFPNPARKIIDEAIRAEELLFSSASAWEIGLLVQKRRLASTTSAADWVQRLASIRGIQLVSLDAQMAVGATLLPERFHDDPADRFLVATARQLNVPIVTRDARILDYAKAGHVRAVAC